MLCLKPGVRPGFQLKQTKRERPPVWVVFLMSVLGMQRDCATCGSRFFCYVLVDFRKSENQKGISCHTHLIRARRGNEDSGLWAAGHDSGLCPKNPQPLKRLAKLLLRLRAGKRVRLYFFQALPNALTASGNFSDGIPA